MESSTQIEHPKLPPLKVVKSGANYYLCTFKNQWQNGRSVAVKGSTKTVGVVVRQQSTGRIKWYEEFLMAHPELRKFNAFRVEADGNDKRKMKAYRIKFELRDSDEEESEEEQAMMPVRAIFDTKKLKAGATWALSQIIKGTPFETALTSTFSLYHRDQKLMSLAMFMYLAKTAIMDDYVNFAKDRKMPYAKPLDGGQCSRLFASIEYSDIQKFLHRLNQEMLRQEEADSGTEHVYYALDSSSISSCSSKIKQKLQFGYNKDGDDLKQINIMMLVNQVTGIPIYYREYTGDVPDVSTVSTFVKEFARLELNRRAIVVADRGYGSPLNVHRFYQTNTGFLLNFRTSFSFSKNMIRQHLAELNDVRNLDDEGKNYACTAVVEWSYPVNYKTNCKVRTPHEKKPLYVHMFLNTEIRTTAEQRFNTEISSILKKLDRGISLNEDEEKLKDKYLVPAAAAGGGAKRYVLDSAKRAEFMMNKGIQILISDSVTTAAEARHAYDMRNSVELDFAMLKQQVGGRRLHVSTEDTMRGKLFVLFLAVSLGLMFRSRHKNSNAEVLAQFKTDHDVLNELEEIESCQWETGVYYSEIVGKRKKILEALGLPLPEKAVFSKKEQELDDAEAGEAPEDITEEERRRQIRQEMLEG